MATVFSKTEAGQQEIRDRGRALPRHARTLLVLADGSRSEEQLLAMVQGSSAADLQSLLDQGLVAETSSGSSSRSGATVPMPLAPVVPAAPVVVDLPLPTAVPDETGVTVDLSYRELYDSLNALSKEQLGLFKGYRFALEIEKAADLAGLRDVAARLVEEVQKAKGDSAAQMVRRALGLKA